MTGKPETFDLIIARMRDMSELLKRHELQRLIGPRTDNALELDWRARLITALNVAEVWPHRG